MGSEIPLEEFKEAWKEFEIREAKKDFLKHLVAYIIVNSFLIFINLWISPDAIWFIWPLGGWAVGLSFHYFFSRPAQVLDEIEMKMAMIESLARKKLKG